MIKFKSCVHLDSYTLTTSDKHVCEECVKTNDPWVHLRTCQTCGITLCCDSSVNLHARKHYNETGHHIIISAEPGERWAHCYEHELYKKY